MEDGKFIICGPPDLEIPYNISLGEYVIQNLQRGGDSVAQICCETGASVTYNEIHQESLKFAKILQKTGIKKGDIISISSENRFEFTVTSLAAMLIGAIIAPLNSSYSERELIHAMKITKPVILFCSPMSIATVMEAIKVIPSVKRIISYGEKKPDPSVILYKDYIMTKIDGYMLKAVQIDAMNDPAFIMCSSGTTGLPKCVMQSHTNMVKCYFNLSKLFQNVIDNGGSMLSIFPWVHAFGFLTSLMSLVMNNTHVFMTKYEKETLLGAIEKYKISFVLLVPTVIVVLAKDPLVDRYDISSLKDIWCGASALSKELQMATIKKTGIQNIKQGYGMSELSIVLGFDVNDNKLGSCGRVMYGMKAKVVDVDSGESLGPYKEGEICFKGSLKMLGYMGDKASTDQMFDSDGWFHTGDIGYYDDEYYFYIVDRLKDLIKYKGHQVPPAEIEGLLLQHPLIRDVGVVGLPDYVAGELPMAFVVLQPGATLTEKEIVDFIAKELSYQKQLHGGVRFVNELPKNSTGKLLRRHLRDLLKPLSKSHL